MSFTQVSKELRRLQLENEDLVGKHSRVRDLSKQFLAKLYSYFLFEQVHLSMAILPHKETISGKGEFF